jgi:hypothetical protein
MRPTSQNRSPQPRGRLSFRHKGLQAKPVRQAADNDNTGGLRDTAPAPQ